MGMLFSELRKLREAVKRLKFKFEDIHGMREGEKVVDIETIIKAYKFCENNEGTCDKCSYFPKKSKMYGCPINNDMISAISEQKAEIDRLKAEQPKWISVSERLPKSMANKVLVFLQHEDYVGYIGYGHYEKYKGTEVWYDLEHNSPFSDRGYTVTHWMELPEEPKDGEQE